jgi:hypothetical protein
MSKIIPFQSTEKNKIMLEKRSKVETIMKKGTITRLKPALTEYFTKW